VSADAVSADAVTAVELARLSATVGALVGQVAELQARLDAQAGSPAPREPGGFAAVYPAFEDRFRGDPADIRRRLSIYLPDLARAARGRSLLDVGPGRGEWLELVAEAGVTGYGVDTDAQFVAAAQAKGQRVFHADAVEHLRTIDDGSLDAVSAFHVIEHLPIDALVDLLLAARGALAPGGVLLLETPNPSNIVMGASNFYLDPTHQRPMPPALTEFLVSAAGFVDIEVRPLHPKEPVDLSRLRLDGVSAHDTGLVAAALAKGLFGPQDYAVIAWAPARLQPAARD